VEAKQKRRVDAGEGGEKIEQRLGGWIRWAGKNILMKEEMSRVGRSEVDEDES